MLKVSRKKEESNKKDGKKHFSFTLPSPTVFFCTINSPFAYAMKFLESFSMSKFEFEIRPRTRPK